MVLYADLDRRTDDRVQLAIEVRRRKQEIFGACLSADPAWDILLGLYAAQLRDERLSLDGLAGDYPPSTLARWSRVLEEQGLVECQTDRLIPSALWLKLTERGALKMATVFQGPDSRAAYGWS